MEVGKILKTLDGKLPEYGFSLELEQVLREYLSELCQREDLLALVQTYHDDIFENGKYTLGQTEALEEKDGREEGLLFAVMYLARYEGLDGVLARRGIPGAYKQGALPIIGELMERNKNFYGSYGLRGMYRSGCAHYLLPDRYVLGRLTFEVTQFRGPYEVYRSKKDGSTLPVALPGYTYMENGRQPVKGYDGPLLTPKLEQTDDEIRGYTFDSDGCLRPEPITIRASAYEKVLADGDDVLSVHIPKNGKMTPEAVDDAFARAETFFARYYPEKNFRAYVCSSWLLDTDLRQLLPAEANIIRFQSRFRTVLAGANGYSLYWHVFGVEHFAPPVELVPQNSFQAALREFVLSGNSLYNGYGYILKK